MCDPLSSDPLGKARASLMLMEFETFVRVSEGFGLLINVGSLDV